MGRLVPAQCIKLFCQEVGLLQKEIVQTVSGCDFGAQAAAGNGSDLHAERGVQVLASFFDGAGLINIIMID